MKIKKILLLLSLLCLLALTLGCAVGCGEEEPAPTPEEPPAPEKITYTVTLKDGTGKHMNGPIIKIMKGEEQVTMLAYMGASVSFEADSDTYTVVLDLSQLEETYSYNQETCVLTPEQKDLTVQLYLLATESKSVFVGDPISNDYTARYVGLGSYAIQLTPNDYTFLIFRPAVAAVYTISYVCDSELELSYHGSTFFVQGHDLSADSEDITKGRHSLSISIYPNNIGGDFVFAIKSTSSNGCILNIENTGEPGTRLEDQPWTPFLENNAKVEQHLALSPVGTYTAVDVTDQSLSAVFNENDGFYHLGTVDGPILFIDLTSDTPYIASIQTICANQRMGIYIYENDTVVEKRSYNELFHQYGMPTDTTAPEGGPIRVPLTAKLAEAIQKFGEKSDWWTVGSEKNIFTAGLSGAPYNQAFAWLLYCGYYA